jgi:hypothetical protein
MAVLNRRITGRFGQIWLQGGSTTGITTSTTANTSAETVDGITYDAYQVWTTLDGRTPPLNPAVVPTITVGASGGPALPLAYLLEVNYLRSKAIITPALASGNTVVFDTCAIPLMYAQGDSSEFSLDAKGEFQDASVQMSSWKHPVLGFREWSGAATIFYKNTDWWLQGAGGSVTDFPIVCRFYPAKGISTEYWYGAAFLSWSLKVGTGSVIAQSVSFTGDGPLIYKAS